MSFEAPMPPRILSPNGRSTHWKKASAIKQYRADLFWLTKEALQKGLLLIPDTELIGVQIECHPRGPTQPDDDNVTGAFKSGRDGMADAMKIDDKRFRYLPVIFREPVKRGKLVVSIFPLTQPDAYRV